MSAQMNLLGMDSYRETRRVVRGQKACAAQLALFPMVGKGKRAITSVPLKKGQRFVVKKTEKVVTFVRRIAGVTFWECEGETYRVTAAQLADAVLTPIM